jgi:hypothetical protein
MSNPTPPLATPSSTPPVPVMPTEVLSAFTTWADALVKTAIADLMAEEGPLWQQFTAWANGWMEQLKTDYSPGGAFAQSMINAVHSFHVFLPNSDGTHLTPEDQDAQRRGWSPLPFGQHEGEAKTP